MMDSIYKPGKRRNTLLLLVGQVWRTAFFSNVVSFEGQGIARLQELQTEKIGNTEIR